MNLSLIPEDTLLQIQKDLIEIKSLLQTKDSTEPAPEWLTKKQAKERLHVCMKTLDKYLKDRVIPYSQWGAKVYIRVSDVDQHLNRNVIGKAS